MKRVSKLASMGVVASIMTAVPTVAADICIQGATSSESRKSFIPSSLEGLVACPANKPANSAVIRMMIPANFDTTIHKRLWLKKRDMDDSSTDDDGMFSGPGSSENASSESTFPLNPAHMDVTTIHQSQTDPIWIKVRVILKNNKFKFWEGLTAKNEPISGIATEYDPNKVDKTWLCQIDGETNQPNGNGRKKTMTFYIRREKGAGKPFCHSVNIIVVSASTNGNDTPLLIDPKIKNEG